MSLQEAGELKSFMISKGISNTDILLNNYIEKQESNLDFLNTKIKAEDEIIKNFVKDELINFQIPKIFDHSPSKIINEMRNKIEGVI